MITAYFHIHTKYSHDSKIEPKDIIKIAEKNGIDVLGICDHNTPMGAIEAKRLSKKVLVLIGQEIKTKYGDLMVFGSGESLRRDLFGLLDKAKSSGLFVILPHPFDSLRKSSSIGENLTSEQMKEVAGKFDSVEIFNSRCFFNSFNKEAKEFARQNRISGIAGSDAHLLNEIENAKNLLNCEKTEEAVYKAIRSGNLTWRAKKTSKLNYLRKFL